MKIILLRHGKPDIPPCKKLKASELAGWIDKYNQADIQPDNQPSRTTIELAKACNKIVCSDLNRSIRSATMMGITDQMLSDPLFREVGLPYAEWSPLTLPPMAWATVFRLLQFLGYRRNGESMSDARHRAREAGHQLAALARTHEAVMLVGHGYMNRLIAKQLLAAGWSGPKTPGHTYWESTIYALDSH